MSRLDTFVIGAACGMVLVWVVRGARELIVGSPRCPCAAKAAHV